MLYMPLACQEYLLNQSAVVVPGFALTLCSLDLITVSGYTKKQLEGIKQGCMDGPWNWVVWNLAEHKPHHRDTELGASWCPLEGLKQGIWWTSPPMYRHPTISKRNKDLKGEWRRILRCFKRRNGQSSLLGHRQGQLPGRQA